MTPYITIGKRKIGNGRPVYIIAEMSANHHKDFQTAVDLVYAAKDAGADAIKLQTFTPDIHTLDSRELCFMIKGGTAWDGKNLYDLYKECEMPWEWQPKLKDLADDIGIDFFSAAVDPTSVEFLEQMNVPVHKVASFEIVDLELIRKMTKTGKPVILSTGMASLAEIEEAVHVIRKEGNDQIALLKCTSAYPALPEEMNLRTIPHLAQMFDVPVGLSDHTLGISVPVAAVALGACIVEKHFTLSRQMPGPDSAFSLEPQEFKAMVVAIRETEKALGRVCYEVSEHEKVSRVFRRSLFIVKDIKKGELFTEDNIRSIRPGYGLAPKYLPIILGKPAKQNFPKGTPITLDLIIGE
jgi:N-acetylneuraminate synthase